MNLSGICLQDLHFGINVNQVTTQRIYYELTEGPFMKILHQVKNKIDFISINGDLFDRKINLNETSSKLVIKFINEVFDICKENDIHFWLIKGTKTHDNDQLDNFKYLEAEYPKFKIFNTFEILSVKNKRVLMLPEEYMENEDEYYKELKNELQEDPVDLILGHGTFDILAFQNQILESERYIKGSPVFKFKEWKEYTTGPIIFGHIHVHQAYQKKLYYGGSYSRWVYNEEKPKGFLLVNISDTEKYKVKFIPNTLALDFNTVNLSDLVDISAPIEEKISILHKVQQENDNIRVRIDLDLQMDKLEILKESMAGESNVKLEVHKKSLKDQIEKEEDNEYSFLSLNNTLSDNVKSYIQKEYDLNFTTDEILDIIFSEDV